MTNQFTFGFQYWNNLIDSTGRTPLFTFPTGIEFGTNTNVPQNSIQRKYQFKDDIAKTIGKHTLKTGIDYIWTPLMGGFFEFNPTLEARFRPGPSCILPSQHGDFGLAVAAGICNSRARLPAMTRRRHEHRGRRSYLHHQGREAAWLVPPG